MFDRGLQAFAHLVFGLVRHEVWLGGKISKEQYKKTEFPGWPEGMQRPKWLKDTVWTLSPEVELGGHQVRLCVATRRKDGEFIGNHGVYVFIDDQITHPGGRYSRWNLPWWWSTRIALNELAEGGRTSPVATRPLLIAEARDKLAGVVTEHPSMEPPTEEMLAAVREVESHLSNAVAKATEHG